MTRPRTQAREAALRALYQLDLRSDLDPEDLEALLGEEALRGEPRAFARELVRGTRARLEEIDREVASAAHNWELRRMASIDRNVLRLGVFELLHRPETPPAVAIDEAVSLAKKYSTRESGAFVNGILDKVHHRRSGCPEAAEQTGE